MRILEEGGGDGWLGWIREDLSASISGTSASVLTGRVREEKRAECGLWSGHLSAHATAGQLRTAGRSLRHSRQSASQHTQKLVMHGLRPPCFRAKA